MPDAAAESSIYSEICEVLQAGLTEHNDHHHMVLKGLKIYFEEHKYLTPNQVEIAQRILGDYEGRKKQGRLF